MKSLTGKFASARGWALLLTLFLGAGLFVVACGDEEVPTPTTPAPPPPAPTPAPPPEPEPTPEPPAVPVGLRISASGVDFIEWSWSAVEGVSGYDVQYSANEAFTDEDEEIARTAEQISYRREDLEAETSHYVRVRSAAGTGDGRVTSGWSTHVTGMTAAATPPPPVAPAAPTNLKASDSGEDFIEWTWDRVVGAAGYIAQFSTDSRFGAGDPEFTLEGVANTKHKVPNLEADSDGYLRVRAYVGAAAEPTLGDWTEGAKGTTEEASAPVTTALSAPTGLDTGSETTTTVTLVWDEVDDADSYDVEQRPAGGSWTGASCNGGSSQVNIEECEASGLTRGTEYSFRVRANPDPDDDTLESSGWSSTASARTSGSTPSTPITGADDDLNITWESDDTSITWFWNAASDNRITNLYAVRVPDGDDPRPACPALGDEAWQSDMAYAIAHKLSVAAGLARGLCVRRTWMDDQDNVQYGPVSVAWAATSPATDITTGIATGRIQPGLKGDAATGTTAIDWYFDTVERFDYVVQTVSAIVGDDLPSCDSGSGSTSFDGSGGMERFRASKPASYTQYRACALAKNDGGASDWKEFTPYSTRPAAPPSPTLKVVTDPITASTESVDLEGTFSHKANVPEDPGSYEGALLVWTGDGNAKSPSQSQCSDQSVTDYARTAVASSAFEETGSGFKFSGSATLTQNTSTTASKRNTVYACVKATSPEDGPWVVRSATVTQPKVATN